MDAVYTWGTADDFKHFLPRLFELLVTDSDAFVDTAAVFAKLNYESWSSSRCKLGRMTNKTQSQTTFRPLGTRS